jgi:hypothetical protein
MSTNLSILTPAPQRRIPLPSATLTPRRLLAVAGLALALSGAGAAVAMNGSRPAGGVPPAVSAGDGRGADAADCALLARYQRQERAISAARVLALDPYGYC